MYICKSIRSPKPNRWQFGILQRFQARDRGSWSTARVVIMVAKKKLSYAKAENLRYIEL